MSKPTAFIDKKQLEFLQVGSQLAVPNQFYDSQLSRVYKAAHLTLAGGQVTKVLVKEYVELGQDVFNKAEFFIAEAKKFRELEHPQIIKFHGVVLNTNSIILEYYAHSLRDVITMSSDSNSPFLSMEDRLACSEDMAEAMYFLHSSANHHKKAVLHRNLQSTSVLVKRDEVTSVLRAKITDFGSSTTLKDNPTSFNNRDKGLQSNASSILRSVRNLSIAPPPHVVNSEHGHKTSSDQKSASLVSTTNSSYIYIAPEIKRKSVKEYGKPCDVFSYGVSLISYEKHLQVKLT